MGVARCGDGKDREEKKRSREEVVKMRGERVGEGANKDLGVKDVR
jgi:hypothetical protein